MAGFKDFLKGAASAAYEYTSSKAETMNRYYEKGMDMSDERLISAYCSASGDALWGYSQAIKDRGLEYELKEELRRRGKI